MISASLRQLGYNFRMPNYRRSYNGSTYFFTVVTYHRQKSNITTLRSR